MRVISVRKLIVMSFICLFFLFFVWSSVGFAKYPDSPITYIVVFSPGGESDVTARMQQKYLEEELGVKILITYKTGGGGAVGWSELVRSKSDGYTIAGVNEPHTILQPLQRVDAGYETEDLTRICCFQYTPTSILVRQDSPFKTMQDLIEYVKEHPGQLTIGGTGTWASCHFTYLLLQKEAGVELVYVPFAGSGTSKPALLGGHVSVLIGHPTHAVSLGDKVRQLAVASDERVAAFPDCPTLKELGYNVVEGSYRGVSAPPGTPKEMVDILAAAFRKINENPEFIKKMEPLGFTLLFWGPEEYNKRIKERTKFYQELLAEYGFKK